MSFTFTSLSKSLIYLYVFIELVFSVCLWMRVCVLWCSRKYTVLDTGAHISHSDLCALFTNWTYFIALFTHKHAIIGRFFRKPKRKKENWSGQKNVCKWLEGTTMKENFICWKYMNVWLDNRKRAIGKKMLLLYAYVAENVCVNCCNIPAVRFYMCVLYFFFRHLLLLLFYIVCDKALAMCRVSPITFSGLTEKYLPFVC